MRYCPWCHTKVRQAWKIQGTDMYKMLAVRSLDTMRSTRALSKGDPGRKRFDLPETLPLPAYRRKARR